MKKSDRFGKHLISCISVLFICLTLLLTMATFASGRPFRLGKIPDQGKNFGCQTCHVNPRGGKDFTPFGADYKKIGLKAGDTYTKELGALDSDGDGFTNDQEFTAGSHPGDPKSKPSH